jgi:predicted ribosomally synthesized peptide with SipW-like signal peptide
MGKHSSGVGADRWILPAAGVLAVLGLVIAGALAAFNDSPDSANVARASCDRPVRVVTATSFAPVLNALAADAEDDDCVRLDVTTADGRAAVRRAAEVGADVWIPDDGSWAGSAGSLGLVEPPAAGAGAVLATSPFYMVADRATGEKLKKAGGGWLALSGMVGPGKGTRLVVRDPIGSGDGMVAAGAVAEAVWVDKDMDASALWLAGAQKETRIVTDGSPALPSKPDEVGVVPEYALRSALKGAGDQLTVLPGVDHTAMLRYSWFPIGAAITDPVRKTAVERLYRKLTGPEAAAPIRAAGLRTPADAQAAGDDGLPAPQAAPFELLGPHHVDHVFATWYADDRRTNLLVVVDVSGSMGAKTAGSNASRIELVRQGCRSVGALLPDESRMGVWEFGSELDGKKDYRTLLAMAPLNTGQRQALGTAITKLKSQETGTGLYDTILAAYTSARNSYRQGVPNQVLIFTDGRNESDKNSITAAQLAAGLGRVADPKRPILLSVVTFGKAAEAKVLENAVKPVEGYVDALTTADEVAAVFIHVAAGGLQQHH